MNNNIEKLHERLYRCRDLEIANLWQRSVFLSVFLILCFTAYGYLSIELIKIYTLGKDYETSVILYNLVGIVLSAIAFIFSCIWIAMAKGSKAWYEVYETRISKLEREYQEQLGIPDDYCMGDFNNDKSKMDDRLFSSKAGAYSVSRINIAIGQISYVIWTIIIISHIICNVVYIFTAECKSGFTPFNILALIASIVFAGTAYKIKLIITKKGWIRSSHL